MADILKHCRKIVIFRCAFGDDGVFAVVDNVGAALRRAVLRVIDAHASLFRVADAVDVHAESAKLGCERVADRVHGQSREIA